MLAAESSTRRSRGTARRRRLTRMARLRGVVCWASTRGRLARGQHDLAREAMLQLVASCQRACPELEEEALVEWVDQEANADLLSPARLEVLREPGPGPALEQLRRLLGVEVHDVAAAAWWAAAPLRRIA